MSAKQCGYIIIQHWMCNELCLKGNELLIFALITGFSQDGESWFTGSRSYVCELLNLSLPTVDAALKSLTKKGLIEKGSVTRNNIILNKYRITESVINEFFVGSKEILPPPQKTLHPPKKILHIYTNNNIYNNTNSIKSNSKKIKNIDNKEIDSIVEIYHQHCPSLPKVRGITESRKRAIQGILAKHKKEVLIEVFDKAEQSDFLTGNNDRGWRANLDFILREDKFIGILEGKYDNKKGKQRKLQMNNLTKEQKERSRKQYEAGKVRTI